ncbi:hypothetical protein CWR43_05285 [Rhizobium sullae]|uniref:Uncharacterized protein n=1 Tax=Rhizobium sullae TaxID=50338 RepID=A0A2N0DGH1_RHISU|nr:hypothetical protein CWR43_05285 [Rhizobium sullae]
MYIDPFSQKMELELGSVPRIVGFDPTRPSAIIDLSEFKAAKASGHHAIAECVHSRGVRSFQKEERRVRASSLHWGQSVEFAVTRAR